MTEIRSTSSSSSVPPLLAAVFSLEVLGMAVYLPAVHAQGNTLDGSTLAILIPLLLVSSIASLMPMWEIGSYRSAFAERLARVEVAIGVLGVLLVAIAINVHSEAKDRPASIAATPTYSSVIDYARGGGFDTVRLRVDQVPVFYRGSDKEKATRSVEKTFAWSSASHDMPLFKSVPPALLAGANINGACQDVKLDGHTVNACPGGGELLLRVDG